jgi:hypothetical protein|tara:strand:+ start:1509 stop:1700 length:192 start_codon:yes stop_codon:yes gene_type:complete
LTEEAEGKRGKMSTVLFVLSKKEEGRKEKGGKKREGKKVVFYRLLIIEFFCISKERSALLVRT